MLSEVALPGTMIVVDDVCSNEQENDVPRLAQGSKIPWTNMTHSKALNGILVADAECGSCPPKNKHSNHIRIQHETLKS